MHAEFWWRPAENDVIETDLSGRNWLGIVFDMIGVEVEGFTTRQLRQAQHLRI
jgi:hypothetical protein